LVALNPTNTQAFDEVALQTVLVLAIREAKKRAARN